MGSGLVNYIVEDPCIGIFRLPRIVYGNISLHWCLVDMLALCIGRTSMERLCHILDLPVLHLVCTYPAATGGVKTRFCHVDKVYNFYRRSNSKYLAVSPVMDNSEQLRPEAMEDLDIPVSQSKT